VLADLLVVRRPYTAGGAPDPVAEMILAEVSDSLQPGDGVEH
jgi:hypothetical protein